MHGPPGRRVGLFQDARHRAMFHSLRFRFILQRPARTAPGTRIYAIGDVHGRQDLLVDLLIRLHADNRARPAADVHFVLLGDLVNRGPDSARVLQLVREWPRGAPALTVLRGNHEAALLAAWHGDIAACRQLHRMGVRATLASYGADVSDYEQWELADLGDAVRRHLPADDIALIEAMPLYWQNGDYVFVHASCMPDVPLAAQDAATLLWSRQHPAPARGQYTAIVHGHANLEAPRNEARRICVDTSAHRSNQLTAVGLEDQQRWFIATTS